MFAKPNSPVSIKARLVHIMNTPSGEILLLVLLAVGYWLVYYWQSTQFGLYEDDLTIIPRAFAFSFPELLKHIWNLISHLYGHARPLHDSSIYVFSWLGWRINGLWGTYWVGYFLTVANIALFYVLIRRATNRNVAFFSALAYCLFASDTTRIFLTLSLGLQPFLLLLFLASHAYLSDKRWLAYILAFIILFGYETPFLVFLGIPLLKRQWDKKWLKELLLHVLILSSMLLVVFFIRLAIGEGRVVELSPMDLVKLPLYQFIKGIIANITVLYYRPLQVITQMTPLVLRAIIVGAVSLILLLLGYLSINQSHQDTSEQHLLGFRLTATMKNLLAGLVMLGSSYLISFTVSASILNGRDARVHAAAIVGASLIVGTLLDRLCALLNNRPLRYFIIPALAVYLAFFVGFGFVVQNEYRLAWTYQKQFWTDLLPQIQDASENEIILVAATGLPETTQIGANTWNVPRMLEQLYILPSDWEAPPRVYRLLPNWQESILTADGNFNLQITNVEAPPSLYGEVDPGNVIYIDAEMLRNTDPININGPVIDLPPQGESVLDLYPEDILHRLIFD